MDRVTDQQLITATREYIENPKSTKMSAAKIGGMSSKTFQTNIGRVELLDSSLFEKFQETSMKKSTSGRISKMDIDKVLEAALVYISNFDATLEESASIAGISERGLQLNIGMLEEKYKEILEIFNATKELKIKSARSLGGKMGSASRDYSKGKRVINDEDITRKLIGENMTLRGISSITSIPKSTIYEHLLGISDPNSPLGLAIRKTLAHHQTTNGGKSYSQPFNSYENSIAAERAEIVEGKK